MSARPGKLLERLRGSRPDPTATGASIVARHFLAQDERPGQAGAVEVERLDPFLRGLLFTDGTVTRALEVQTLAPVSVQRLEQARAPVPADLGGHLEVEGDAESIRRRVRIGTDAGEPVLWAESYLLLDRLPPGFMGLLDGAPDGIGQSLQRVALESYRELLWLGFDDLPVWAGDAAGVEATIRRLYRIVSGRQASILISESFAVTLRGDTYYLAAVAAADGESAP